MNHKIHLLVVWFGNSISFEIEANGVTSVNGGPLPVELVRAPYCDDAMMV
jgi:hypothetical protein